MKRLLVVCGPTATGKTSLALYLAKVFDGELVSADSRQVYKGMDIGTGKDLPKNLKSQISNLKIDRERVRYYVIDGIKIWGYDLVEAREEFSVAQYIKIKREIIKDIWNRGKLPILVGGTGLYIKGVVDGIPTANVPKNRKLRKSLESKSVEELFKILTQIEPIKAEKMNLSDRKNPRRLIRAIEISRFKAKESPVTMNRFIETKGEMLFVGLTAPKKYIENKVNKRVEMRVKEGLEKEIKKLLKSGITWQDQAMQALGYKQWQDYFEKIRQVDVELDEVRKKAINKWTREEKQYAKRQMTWFKKDKRINWFDISKENWKNDVEKLVREWYI